MDGAGTASTAAPKRTANPIQNNGSAVYMDGADGRRVILFEFDSTGTYTITGGTGCFTDATGSGQATTHSSQNDPNNASLEPAATG
jgi:hypothetical protein